MGSSLAMRSLSRRRRLPRWMEDVRFASDLRFMSPTAASGVLHPKAMNPHATLVV